MENTKIIKTPPLPRSLQSSKHRREKKVIQEHSLDYRIRQIWLNASCAGQPGRGHFLEPQFFVGTTAPSCYSGVTLEMCVDLTLAPGSVDVVLSGRG